MTDLNLGVVFDAIASAIPDTEVLVWRDRSALPAGVSAAGIALLLAMLVFLGVSWLTRAHAARDLDADVAMIMEQ